MKLTHSERLLIQEYLNHYYEKHSNSKDALPFKTQMELLYNYATHLEE